MGSEREDKDREFQRKIAESMWAELHEIIGRGNSMGIDLIIILGLVIISVACGNC